MINVTLPDGSVRKYEDGASPSDVAMSISPGLHKAALAAKESGRLPPRPSSPIRSTKLGSTDAGARLTGRDSQALGTSLGADSDAAAAVAPSPARDAVGHGVIRSFKEGQTTASPLAVGSKTAGANADGNPAGEPDFAEVGVIRSRSFGLTTASIDTHHARDVYSEPDPNAPKTQALATGVIRSLEPGHTSATARLRDEWQAKLDAALADAADARRGVAASASARAEEELAAEREAWKAKFDAERAAAAAELDRIRAAQQKRLDAAARDAERCLGLHLPEVRLGHEAFAAKPLGGEQLIDEIGHERGLVGVVVIEARASHSRSARHVDEPGPTQAFAGEDFERGASDPFALLIGIESAGPPGHGVPIAGDAPIRQAAAASTKQRSERG